MSGDYSEVSSQSWFSRIMEAIKGVLIGVLLVLISFPLLAWNEYRAVTTAKSLEEGSKALVTVEPDKVVKDNEGKFVHMTGLATTTETLKDEDFGVSAANAIHLNRKVEMYQWQENKKTEKKKKLGGGEETVTTYTYTKVWSEKPINSSLFNEKGKEAKEKEIGPEKTGQPDEMPYESKSWTATKVTLGAFTLPPTLVLDKIKKLEEAAANHFVGQAPRRLQGRRHGGVQGENPRFSHHRRHESLLQRNQAGGGERLRPVQVGDTLVTRTKRRPAIR